MVLRKKISGFAGRYSVDSEGNIFNDNTGRKLKPGLTATEKGYRMVVLSERRVKANKLVHRLVAEAFLPNPDNKLQVNHIDGNKMNNNVNNLEWCTGLENMNHAYRLNLIPTVKGEQHRWSKLTIKKAEEIRKLYAQGETQKRIAKQFGLCQGTISLVINHRLWNEVR